MDVSLRRTPYVPCYYQGYQKQVFKTKFSGFQVLVGVLCLQIFLVRRPNAKRRSKSTWKHPIQYR